MVRTCCQQLDVLQRNSWDGPSVSKQLNNLKKLSQAGWLQGWLQAISELKTTNTKQIIVSE